MKLFHYTSIYHLQRILEYGSLCKGDIPITRKGTYGSEGHAVWLTTRDKASPNEHGLISPVCDKTEIRITIEVDLDDPRLFKWSDYAKRRGVERGFYRQLDVMGGGLSNTWWLYIGEIPIMGNLISQKVNGRYQDIIQAISPLRSNVQNCMQAKIGTIKSI